MPGKHLLLAALLALFCLGCARPYAGHLQSAPWLPGAAQHLTTKTLDFTYEGVTTGHLQGIRGKATLLPGAAPDWAVRYERIVLKVYVSDDTGRIIGTYTLPCLPRAVSEPIGFELLLDIPPDADRETYYLAFGYLLVIRGDDPNSLNIIRQEDAGF